MKRHLLLLLLLFITGTSLGAQPTYQLILKNDSLVSNNIYEFDMYIVRTGVASLQLATLQTALTFNTSISTGVLTFTIDNGTSGLNVAQTPTNGLLSVSGNELLMQASPDPGTGNGTIIPTNPGLRVGRFRVTSSVPFSNAKADLAWNNSGTPPATQVQTYNTDTSDHSLVDITDSTGHLVSLTNASLSPLGISSSATLPAGTNTVPYADTLIATDGTPPYSWTLVSGSLPSGLNLLSSGIVSGTTFNTGPYSFTAKVNDSALDSVTKTFSLTINSFVDTITASSGLNGSISPNGSVGVNYGSNQQFTITPSTGYHLDSLIVDGVRNTDSTASYTFVNVTANHTIRVTFLINQYTITPSSGVNGSISPSVPVNVNYGSNQQFTITPSTGYHLDSLIVDGVRNTDSTASYTFVNVTANHTIRVTFAINHYTITASSGSNGTIAPSGATNVNYGSNQQFTITPTTGYHLDSLIVDGVRNTDSTTSYTFIGVTAAHTIRVTFLINQYTITPSSGANGSISPSVPVNVNYGSNQQFTITPTTGYHLDSLIVDGVRNTDSTTSYTFIGVTAAHTIRVTFAITQFTITASSGSNGTIAPSGVTNVSYGSSQQFTITPSTGYHLDSLIVDGVRNTDSTSSYTFKSVSASHTIRVTFLINQYTITASSGSNGSINPTGLVNVNYGGSQLFTFTPSTGYHVDSLYLDGVYSGNPASYTFTNDTANHTIRVTFAINQYTITPSSGPNGSISPSVPTNVSYGGSQCSRSHRRRGTMLTVFMSMDRTPERR